MMKYVFPLIILLVLQSLSVPTEAQVIRDIHSDTWIATDDLGRTLPDASQVGPPKSDKKVGMFYFLWNGFRSEDKVYDVSKIIQADPRAIGDAKHPLWGPLKTYHHWAESIFGYYSADDHHVLRKHAQMLGDAGIDVIIFDVTNQDTFSGVYRTLGRVFEEERAKGNHTPQIAFLVPFFQPENVVRELWEDIYSKGDFKDLWFYWKGKPLIMADPNLILAKEFPNQNSELLADPVPVNGSLGQSFSVDRPFLHIAVKVPTWYDDNAAATLTLRADGPQGEILISKRFESIADNSWLGLDFDKPFPHKKYYIEISQTKGKIGWWSVGKTDLVPGGESFANGRPNYVSRKIRMTMAPEDSQTEDIMNFFSFRAPQASYFTGPTAPNQWGWLEVYPQHGFYTKENAPASPGKPPRRVEQVAVGVAQNAVDGKLSVLSHPRSHGRSFHQGKQPKPNQCDFSGKNFAEQWQRAFELDPEFVFITSWNEWIMMRFGSDKKLFYGMEDYPVNFVDQFNWEFSRDIEPVKGFHGDAYYYQTIAAVRKFKGVRKAEAICPLSISIDGRFADWENISPEFRDTIGDQVQRNHRGHSRELHYVNKTGQNDIVAAKVSFDTAEKCVYFYVRTQENLVGMNKPNRMLLYLDVDADAKTGWLGYDYLVEAKALKKNEGKEYTWKKSAEIDGVFEGNEYEIAIPFHELGFETLPAEIRFKWADNILQDGTWSDFTINGDVAPNDRYNYRALFK